jgi:hypothetical protein
MGAQGERGEWEMQGINPKSLYILEKITVIMMKRRSSTSDWSEVEARQIKDKPHLIQKLRTLHPISNSPQLLSPHFTRIPKYIYHHQSSLTQSTFTPTRTSPIFHFHSKLKQSNDIQDQSCLAFSRFCYKLHPTTYLYIHIYYVHTIVT